MEVEVYADLLFLVNAGMDGLCFGLTGRILHRRLSRLRILFGAVLGGIYGVGSLFLTVGAPIALGLDIAVCLLMCGIVFGKGHPGMRRFLGEFATYSVLSMVLGGVMTALYHLLNRLDVAALFPADEDSPEIWLFGLLALAGSALTLWGGRALRREAGVQRCRVIVTVGGRRAELEGLVDTGNLLRDPLSGRPVICVARRALSPILPTRLAEALESGDVEGLAHTADAGRFRIIPAGTATGRGLLNGFLPDEIQIRYIRQGRSNEEVTCGVEAVLAVTELGDTQALVPSALL